jgi:RNA polymerase sigma factor (sigma-70 family)
MADARDAEDTQWLEEGDAGLARLLAKYEPVILGRCMARLRGDDAAFDVSQAVMLRLVDEFRRGKRYPVPYRVVVHQVIGWTLNDHFGGKPAQPFDEAWNPGVDDAELAAMLERHDLMHEFASLPERQRQVCELRYLAGLEPDQIATKLGMQRNAVDQALHNAHRKLKEARAHA